MRRYNLMRRLLTCIILFLLFACNKHEKFINSPEDFAFAKKLASDFYIDLDRFDTIKISNYLSSEINKDEFNKGLLGLVENGGKRINVDISKIETNTEVINNEKHSIYNIEVTAKYEKLTAIETLSFVKKETLAVKLVSYHAELK